MARPFEILSEISDVETFATGTGVRERSRLRRIYGPAVAGASEKGLRRSGCRMAQFTKLSYTGMRQVGLDVANSKSNTSSRT